MILDAIKNIPSISLLLDEKFCVWITDRQGLFTYVNKNFCLLSQYEENELIGQSFSIVHPNFTAERSIPQVEKEIAEMKVWQRNLKNFAKDGSPFWVNATVIPILDEHGTTTHFLSIDTDITSKELADFKYKEAVENLRNIENALNQSSVVVVTDPAGKITYVNDKFLKLSKYSSEELIGKTHRVVNSGHHPKDYFKEMWQTIRSGRIWRGDIKNQAKDGSAYWVNTTIVPFLDKSGKPYQYIAIRTDITARKEAEESLQEALKNDFRQTVKNLQNAIFKYTLDEDGEIVFTLIEGKIAEKFNFTAENLNSNLKKIKHLKTNNDNVYKHLLLGMQGTETDFELSFRDFTFLFYLSPIFEGGHVVEVVGTASDITERKQAERTIERMAYYDSLTGLPNRRLLKECVKEAIQKAKLNEEELAIMFIDLDRFKNVNDSMGHFVGDQLLQSVGERLKTCVRDNDVVARLNGDEFVILFPSTNAAQVESVAARIIEEISEPFQFNSVAVYISGSIGISMFPQDGADYDTLLSNADSAMYLSKEVGKSTYQFFTKELREAMLEKTLLEMELRQALKKGQLHLHYQPQFNTKTGQLKGLEALARWDHPSLGPISPGRFIPIAEETGLILPIGNWVMRTACMQVKSWEKRGLPSVRISVNVSARQFMQPAFVSQVQNILHETGLHPKKLNIEITESMTMDVDHCLSVLSQLNEIGVSVSIDDFGTGYSSLSYLGSFPISHLKIDQSFVREMSPKNRVIVKSIIDLAKNLNLNVIAEGVETEEQALFLSNLQCDEVQGFLFSKPLPVKEAEELLIEAQSNSKVSS
ncbi:diguanylate cyclase/phosphodiesterase with pas/pac sensor(s) [Bacillus sp. OxB-1]|uniref:EAL domain-containing protein n=1 Tax=Bacillus sp. (strain OxB-1) TaxID=98228 RepID=UPI0005821899|nr:EAL domain-containing protein [Bacillus sp. OxB-1]BAQ09336.1 diguanylate cyclase/phosphodiesterase with pas/pac sensor(s) [Bacillus sp. OxB-1]